MDVLLIADFCGKLTGKDNNRFVYLANLLCKEHDVEILTSDFYHFSKSYFTEKPEDFPFKITLVHEGLYEKNVSLRRLYAHYIWGRSVKAYLCKRKRPDVIYAAVPPLYAAYLVAEYCEKNNIRFMVDIQDLWPEGFKEVFNLPVVSKLAFMPFYFLANSVYKRADEIMAVSDMYVNRALRVSAKCKSGNTVFLGTELEAFDRNVEENARRLNGQNEDYNDPIKDLNGNLTNLLRAKRYDEVWLAYCGNLGTSYDLNLVFKAMRIVNDQRLKFIVMGDGERRKEFETNAKGLQCVFTGKLPYRQFCGLLAACDIAVNSISRGSCQSIMNKHADYVAAGLPVLNTQDCEEYRRLIDSYNMGFNCENENAADLAAKLKILLNDKNLRTKMGRNARRCAEERFDRAKTYQLICDIVTKKCSL